MEVTGQKSQGWICHPAAGALSVLPLGSVLRPLHGLELAQAGPTWIQGWRGPSKARSSQSPLWQEQRGRDCTLICTSPLIPPVLQNNPAVDDLAQSHLLKDWGLHQECFPKDAHSTGSFLCLSYSRGAGKALVSHWSFPPSLLWPIGPSPALSWPWSPRALVGWPRRPQDGRSCLTRSPFPFVTEEAVLELKFKDFSV